MANVELAEQVMRHIEDNPQVWDQSAWFCGTAARYAGHAVLMSGWKRHPRYASLVCNEDESECIFELACDLLEINLREGNILFNSDNTLESLQLMTKDLANGDTLTDHWQWMNSIPVRREEGHNEH